MPSLGDPMKRSIVTNQAQNLEVYGLEVNLLSPASLDAYQVIMSRPNGSIVAGNIREDAEVVL